MERERKKINGVVLFSLFRVLMFWGSYSIILRSVLCFLCPIDVKGRKKYCCHFFTVFRVLMFWGANEFTLNSLLSLYFHVTMDGNGEEKGLLFEVLFSYVVMLLCS